MMSLVCFSLKVHAGLRLRQPESDALLLEGAHEVAKLPQVEAVRVDVLHLVDGRLDVLQRFGGGGGRNLPEWRGDRQRGDRRRRHGGYRRLD